MVLKNASFYGNRAISAAGKAFGGAVYGNAVKITADGGNSVFAGNYANDENNAVYVADILNFQLKIREKSRWMTVLTEKTII